jgi:HEAT repeat protein
MSDGKPVYFYNNALSRETGAMSKRREILVQLLKDPDSDVRAAAAAALERLEELQGVDDVLQQLKKGSLVEKVRAIHALGEIGGEKVIGPLNYCVSRPEADLRGAAIDALGKIAHPSSIPLLLEKLKEENSGIRARAIRALGRFRDSSLNLSLLPFLDAGDGLTDVEAALALARTGDASLEEKLARLALSPIPATRAAAATALGLLKPA